jgi:hypothetical protein
MSSSYGMTETGPVSDTSYYNELKEMGNYKIVMILQPFITTYGKAGIYWPQQTHNYVFYCYVSPIPVAVGSEVWVYGSSLAGIVGSNPAGGMDVYLCWVLCVSWSSLRRADHSSREVLPNVMRRCVWSRHLKNEEAMARVAPQPNKNKYRYVYIFLFLCMFCSVLCILFHCVVLCNVCV